MRITVNIFSVLALTAVCAVAQSSGAPAAANEPVLSTSNHSNATMFVPPPVAGTSYSLAFTSEERSNYLRGGITFQANHDDDVLTAPDGSGVGGWSYSIWPSIEIDQSWPRFEWRGVYQPGFTFYENVHIPGTSSDLTSYNQQDQNLALRMQYRLSPHVTLGLRDSLQKTSNLFNQPQIGSTGTIGGSPQGPNDSIVTPVSNVLRNTAGGDLTYQFSRDDMVGIGGTVTNLHFLNPQQDVGLFDAAARGGSAFYTHRFAERHYVGVSYLYQQLITYGDGIEFPSNAQNQTITDSIIGFYTFYPRRTLSLSVFGGPQYSSTTGQFGVANTTLWTPTAGASIGWQGHRTSAAASYLRTVTDGGGLLGAVHSNAAALTVREQLARWWSAGATGTYASNTLVVVPVQQLNDGGHTVGGSVWVQRNFSEHFYIQAGYSHLHQNYDNVAALADVIGRNREWISVTYLFSRPLGR